MNSNSMQPLVLMIKALSPHEAYSYFIAAHSFSKTILISLQNSMSPLYYIALHIWIRFFGKGEIMMRSFSLICFAMFLYVIHHFIEDVFHINGKKGYGLLLCFVFNPLFLYLALIAEPYMLFVMLLTTSWLFLLKKKYAQYLFVSLLAGLSHYLFIIMVLFQGYFIYRNDRSVFPVFINYFSLIAIVIMGMALVSSNNLMQLASSLPYAFLIMTAFALSLVSIQLYRSKLHYGLLYIVVLFAISHIVVASLVHNMNKNDIREDLKNMRKTVQKQDNIYIYDEKNYYQALYYYGDVVYVYNHKKTEKIITNSIPENRFVKTLPFYPNKAFIFKSNEPVEARALY